MRWADHVARMGDENLYKGLVEKPEGKRQFGRRRRRWDDSFGMKRQGSCELGASCSG
jgi:hypothetical protein